MRVSLETYRSLLCLMFFLLIVACKPAVRQERVSISDNVDTVSANESAAGMPDSGIPVGKADMLALMDNPSQTVIPRIVHDLYPVMDTLPAMTEDSVWAVRRLWEKGWEQLDGGSGNWQNGPRMIRITMKKGKWYCTVNKAYTFYKPLADGAKSLLVTEQVSFSAEPVQP